MAIAPVGSRGLIRMMPSGRYSRNPPHRGQFGVAAGAAGAEQQAVALRLGGVDEAVERLGEERVVEVVEQHGHHPDWRLARLRAMAFGE